MRIAYFGNNWLGWQVLQWLKDRGEELVILALHPRENAKFREELLAASGFDERSVVDASRLAEPDIIRTVADRRPQLGISVGLGYILRPQLLQCLNEGCINVHTSLLPHNRGANPNIWSIIDGTPSGVTIHWVDAGVDTGDIIAQRQVPVEPTDTAGTLHQKLQACAVALFKEQWPLIRSGSAPRIPQSPGLGKCHRVRDLNSIAEIQLDQYYTGRELINLLRARTFPPYAGAYFRVGDRKVFLSLELTADSPPIPTARGRHCASRSETVDES